MSFSTIPVLLVLCGLLCSCQSFQIRRCGQTEVAALTDAAVSQEAKPHSLPFVVSLVRRYKTGLNHLHLVKRKSGHICGGVLLQVKENVKRTDIALTTASCGKKRKRFSNINDGDFYVIAGGHNLSHKLEGRVKVRGELFIPHYLFSQNEEANDIAIVKLKHPINFTENIQPACLPTKNDPRWSQLTVAGWGSERKGAEGKTAHYHGLRQNIITKTDWEHCHNAYNLNTAGRELCATTGKEGRDSCEGDSGGAAVSGTPSPGSTYAAYTLRGIGRIPYGCVQYTNPPCITENSPCYSYAGVYTNVTSFLGWINQTIDDYSEL